ncbi:MAG: DUF2961 domain-containing protein [Pirellulales bacterium]|nr:DUF2961 domain-containing protein [Pirellulales bacterium]
MIRRSQTENLVERSPSRRSAGSPILFWLCFAVLLLGMPLAAAAQTLMDGLAKPLEGRSMRATSTFRRGADGNRDPKADPLFDPKSERSNSDNFQVKPGETHVLMDAQGPGVVTHIWVTFLGPEPQNWAPKGAANHQEMLLRIYYDGSDRPAVEAPVGDFFANCFGKRSSVVSLPVIVEDADSYNCFWHMPFRKSIRVEIVNESEKEIRLLYYNIDWIKKDSIPEDTPYFYAQYKQEYPVEQGKDYVILETQGKGHYVGTVMAVRTRSPFWFGEGDEKIYIDGEQKPSIWGTGTEDYFLSAWGLQTTSTPYFGTPYFDQWGIVGGHTSAYRWHIGDPIVFNKGIKVTIEHWGWISPDENPDYKAMSWNERQDDYSSVAFWYQTGTPTFTARAPHGRERTLPGIERVKVMAKDFTGEKSHGPGTARTQLLGTLYPEPQLIYEPEKAESGWIEIPFEVTKKEPLRVVLNCTRAPDYGRYQASIDGVKIGQPMDLYHEKIDNFEFQPLDFWPEPGKYTLRLECVGKNMKSEGYKLGLESVNLRERRPRVVDYGHDKDKDWKKNPTVYTD